MRAGSAAYFCFCSMLSLFFAFDQFLRPQVDSKHGKKYTGTQGSFYFYADSNVLVYKSKVKRLWIPKPINQGVLC